MNLLVSSHAGVLSVNRKIFSELAKELGWKTSMFVPLQWNGDLIKSLKFEKVKEDDVLNITPLKTYLSGNGSIFFYHPFPKMDQEPDVIFVDEEPWSLCALQLFFKFRKSKKIFYTKQNLIKKIPFPFNLIQKFIFKNAEGAFVISDEAAGVLTHHGFKKKIMVLPHSYDPDLFFKKDQKSNSEKIRIAYVGRLEKEKGIDLFIKAISPFLNSSKAEFHIVGSGAMESEVELKIKELNSRNISNVFFNKAIPHNKVGEFLRTLDVLVLPSQTTKRWKEQFGRILVEAWASGAAVIGSNSGEIPNLIRKANGGLIFEESSDSDLSNKMRELIEDRNILDLYKKNGLEFVNKNLTHKALSVYLASCLKQFFKSSTY